MRRLFWLSVVLVLGSACGGESSSPPDAAAIDGGGGADASSTDAGPPAGAREAREIVSGGGRVTGGAMTMDVQLGHPVQQGPAAGGSLTVEGGAAIKP
jgi:hypothetical protein